MRSKTSYFDKGLCLNYIKRYWPLWLGWLTLLMLLLPAEIPGMLAERQEYWLIESVERHLLQSGVDLVYISIFAVLPVVAAMFSHLYNSRGCSMINSLPVRRETVFVTGFVTGLVPMLLSVVLTAAVTALLLTGRSDIAVSHLWSYLAAGLLSVTAFYGMAAFCAMLTGNMAVFPAMYLLLNVAAVLAEGAVKSAVQQFVYGFNYNMLLMPLSPLPSVVNEVIVTGESYPIALDAAGKQLRYITEYSFEGMGILAVYCVAGLALAVLALLLYKRRAMECVGDVVAIPVLRPIFKYAMSFGMAFCFAALVYTSVFERLLYGAAEAAAMLVLLLVGALIGYFASEMLLQKTLRVFKGKWKGYVVVALILIVFVGVWEFDVTGYERYVPKAEDIEHVNIYYVDGAELHETENLALTADYHSRVISRKAENESADNWESINLSYTLKNGRVINRRYYLADDMEQHLDESSNIRELAALINVPEAIDYRLATRMPANADNIVDAYLNAYYMDEEGMYQYQEFRLSAQQAAELYNDCLLADASNSHLGHIWTVRDMDYYNYLSNVTFSFGVVDKESSKYEQDWRQYYHDFKIYTDAELCCDWIAENTDIVLLPLIEAEPNQLEQDGEIYDYPTVVMNK